MILLTLLLLITIILMVVTVAVLSVVGAAGIVIFGDVIVCILGLVWIIKKFASRKK